MTQTYQLVIQEDLNVGTGMTYVTAPTGGELRATQTGLHTVARGQRAYEAAWTPGAILTTGKASTTVSVPDAATGDLVLASHDKILTSDLRIAGHVSASGTVKVVIHNPTGVTVTVAAGTVAVIVFPFIGNAIPEPPVATSTVEGTVTLNGAPQPGETVSMTVDGVAWPGGNATCDGSGFFQFLLVPAGTVEVMCAAVGGNFGTTVPPMTLVLDIAGFA